MSTPNSQTLAETLAQFSIELPAEQVATLNDYCRRLWEWNEKLNLTRHTDYEKFVTRDVVDSLKLGELLEAGESVLDVGTGGGVPGVILAITRPELKVSLCESTGKKAAAVKDIVRSLNLPVAVHHARAEALLDYSRFDTLAARAIGPLSKMLYWFAPHWPSIGRLLAIKGPKWVEERGEARHRGLLHDLELRRVSTYETPGIGTQNVILCIRPKSSADA